MERRRGTGREEEAFPSRLRLPNRLAPLEESSMVVQASLFYYVIFLVFIIAIVLSVFIVKLHRRLLIN